MADKILNSNSTSVILSSLDNSDVIDLSYYLPQSYPNFTKERRAILPVNQPSGAPHNQTVIFNLDKSLLWYDAMIRVDYTVPTGMTMNHQIGLDAFESIELRSNNKRLFSYSDVYLNGRANFCSPAEAAVYKRLTVPLNTSAATHGTFSAIGASSTTGTFFVPIFSPFFERKEQFLDLEFLEQIQLVCRFASADRSGVSSDGVMSAATCSLYTSRMALSNKNYEIYKSLNYAADEVLDMIGYDTFTESVGVVNTTTSTSITLNVRGPVMRSYVYIRKEAAANAGSRVKLNTATFKIAGAYVLDSYPVALLNAEVRKRLGSGFVSTVSGPATNTASALLNEDILCIDWSMEPWNRSTCTGALSFTNVNNPVLEISHIDPGATTAKLYVCHEMLNVMSIYPQNGTINVTQML